MITTDHVSKIIRDSLASRLKLSFLLRSAFHERNLENTLGDIQRIDIERLGEERKEKKDGG